MAIETFEVLVIRVHDIYSNRILNVLMSMQDVQIQTLPAGRGKQENMSWRTWSHFMLFFITF